jgi:tRNA A-37 threonylcarbamoyl transferase component Bud32
VTQPPREAPLASGREADVFVLDDERVLRRYRNHNDAAREAAIMAYVRRSGFPVPVVYAAQGPEMVMERLHGPTMAEAALAGDLSVADSAAMLADLHRRLHALPAQSGPETIVHLDLHPMNVLLTERGPVVIDWPNARDGPGDLDTALSALILAQVAIGSIVHELVDAAGPMLDLFLELAPGDPARLLDDAVALRKRQLDTAPEEVAMLGLAATRVKRL